MPCEHVALRYTDIRIETNVSHPELKWQMPLTDYGVRIWCLDCEFTMLASIPSTKELMEFWDKERTNANS